MLCYLIISFTSQLLLQKVVTSVSEDKFGAWEKAGFPPEKDFIGKIILDSL